MVIAVLVAGGAAISGSVAVAAHDPGGVIRP